VLIGEGLLDCAGTKSLLADELFVGDGSFGGSFEVGGGSVEIAVGVDVGEGVGGTTPEAGSGVDVAFV